MIKKGAILLSNFSSAVLPQEWSGYEWQEVVRAGKGYRVIESFDKYFSPAVVNQFDFVGAVEEFDDWMLADPERLYEEDLKFGREMMKEYQIYNRSLNLTTADSLAQLHKFQAIAALLDRGSIRASAALLQNIQVDSIFTQERKDYFIQRFTDYLS